MLRGTASCVKRHHLTLLALFFALGGTSVAAGNAFLPRNSVDEKNNTFDRPFSLAVFC